MRSMKGGLMSSMISSFVHRWRTLVARTRRVTASTTSDEISSSVRSLFRSEASTDYEWAGPTLICPCGSDTFLAIVTFDEDRALAQYFTEGRCAFCNADVRLPTEADTNSR